MEQEKIYKSIKSKISGFKVALTSLNEFSVAKMQSDAHKDIETHFESLFKSLQQCKDELIHSVDQLSLEIQQQVEIEKKELKDKIEATNKILEVGTSLYQFQPDVAIGIWENVRKIPNTTKNEEEKKELKLDLPSLLINSHGKVSITTSKLQTKQHVDQQPVLFKASVVSTLAGSSKGKEDGKGINAKFTNPEGVTFNSNDHCLYVCDYDNKLIRKVTQLGEVSTFVNCTNPIDITFYQKENCFFISEWKTHSIKRMASTGEMSTFAGGNGRGHKDGEGVKAMFNYPYGITVNEVTGDVYVADNYNHVVRKITSQGKVTTLAGTPGKSGYEDGAPRSSLFDGPYGMCFHPLQQALIVCDSRNNRLRKVSLDGNVSTVCKINNPFAATVLSSESILISSSHSNQIFKVSFFENKTTQITFAGSGKEGNKEGTPQESQFDRISGLTIDNITNTCYVADFNNHRIRAIKFD